MSCPWGFNSTPRDRNDGHKVALTLDALNLVFWDHCHKFSSLFVRNQRGKHRLELLPGVLPRQPRRRLSFLLFTKTRSLICRGPSGLRNIESLCRISGIAAHVKRRRVKSKVEK